MWRSRCGYIFTRSSDWKDFTPRTGVTGDWVVSHLIWKWEMKLGPSAKVVLLITADPSFQPHKNIHDVKNHKNFIKLSDESDFWNQTRRHTSLNRNKDHVWGWEDWGVEIIWIWVTLYFYFFIRKRNSRGRCYFTLVLLRINCDSSKFLKVKMLVTALNFC